MKEFDIKRGHFKKIDGGGLKQLMSEKFGDVREGGDALEASWGALEKLTVRLEGKNTLWVDTKMRTDVSEDEATETIKRYNTFMEAATGFSAKERKKRAEKKAKGNRAYFGTKRHSFPPFRDRVRPVSSHTCGTCAQFSPSPGRTR